jgi:hypothetical protein
MKMTGSKLYFVRAQFGPVRRVAPLMEDTVLGFHGLGNSECWPYPLMEVIQVLPGSRPYPSLSTSGSTQMMYSPVKLRWQLGGGGGEFAVTQAEMSVA